MSKDEFSPEMKAETDKDLVLVSTDLIIIAEARKMTKECIEMSDNDAESACLVMAVSNAAFVMTIYRLVDESKKLKADIEQLHKTIAMMGDGK